jgi:glycosyltransferase involved in cell wall biosynthesis
LKILYIHQYFKTPVEGGAIRSWYISKAMVEAGHEVHMITSHNENVFAEKEMGGIHVYYLPVKYRSSFGFYRRIAAFLVFSWRAYRLGRKLGKPGLMYVSSTPLTVGIAAILLRKRFRSPYVFEVRDLWPEVPIQMNIIRNPLVKSAAVYLEKRIYAGAEGIIALSPGIEQHIRKLSPLKPVHFCPNMSDCDFFDFREENVENILEKYRLEGKFVIGYFGAIGRSNALGYLLDVAEVAKTEGRGLAFLIIGEGPGKPELMNIRESLQLEDLHFIDHQDKIHLRKYLTVIDAAYISFAGMPVFQLNSPNKFFDALASSKMIISNTGGWIRKLIETHQCGLYYDPEDKRSFFDKLQPILEDPQKLASMKKNAGILAVTHFERKMLIKKLFSFLNI